MRVAVIDYGSGNLHSVAKAFERAARDLGLPALIEVTADPDRVRQSERIVLPGVGAFRDCRDGLAAVPGMWETVEAEVGSGKPFLGICVGMQLMAERGLEHVETRGFGWIKGDVKAIRPEDAALKIPHMGWNTLDPARPHALFDGIALGAGGLHAYFVHSYHLALGDPSALVATTDHGGAVTAFVARDNMAGSQFHPEKSQALGLALIGNFLKWRP
ncbi:MAG: imidazole glycerol phosphate synthase subunit HisH [Parvibaculaceae bacterium]